MTTLLGRKDERVPDIIATKRGSRKIVDNTHGMYGELQAVTGRALQQIKRLELPPREESSGS